MTARIARSERMGLLALLLFSSALAACSTANTAARLDGDDITGVVTGPRGPEAGVWVIAQHHRSADAVHAHRRHR